MKTFDDIRGRSNDQVDLEGELLEEGIGKVSSTVLLGRLKGLTRGIKDKSLSQSIFNLGMMASTISLQIPNQKVLNKKLDDVGKDLVKLRNQNEVLKKEIVLLKNDASKAHRMNMDLKNKMELVLVSMKEIKRTMK